MPKPLESVIFINLLQQSRSELAECNPLEQAEFYPLIGNKYVSSRSIKMPTQVNSGGLSYQTQGRKYGLNNCKKSLLSWSVRKDCRHR
jgi:hypothetical protein